MYLFDFLRLLIAARLGIVTSIPIQPYLGLHPVSEIGSRFRTSRGSYDDASSFYTWLPLMTDLELYKIHNRVSAKARVNRVLR
jgi:hypothetical protein